MNYHYTKKAQRKRFRVGIEKFLRSAIPIPPKDRFSILIYKTFEIDEGSWSKTMQALEIFQSPRKEERFAIVEYHYSFACSAYYVCHYYSSEKTLRNAFVVGLTKALKKENSPPKPEKKNATFKDTLTAILEEFNPKSVFVNHPGYLKTKTYDNFEKPWFLAKEGEIIRNGRAISKEEKEKAPLIKKMTRKLKKLRGEKEKAK